MEWLIEQVSKQVVKKAIKGVSNNLLFSQAAAQTTNGNIQEALSIYNRIIQSNPNDSAAYGNRGVLLASMGEHESAIQDFTQSIRIDPFIAQSYFSRARSLFEIGSYQVALDDYSKAIDLEPNQAFIYIRRGFCLLKMNAFEAAKKDFEHSMKLQPQPSAYHGRGMVYGQTKKPENAVSDFSKVIELNPDYFSIADVLYYRGLSNLELGHIDAALSDFEAILAKSPNSALAYYGIGLSKMARVNIKDQATLREIAENFSLAISLQPRLIPSYFQRAYILTLLGDYGAAIRDYGHVLQADDSDINAFIQRGNVRMYMDDLSGGIDDHRKAAEIAIKTGNLDLYEKISNSISNILRESQNASTVNN